MTAPWLQEALCSTPGAALTPAGPPEHPAGGRRGAPPPARTATPCCHLPPGASTALPASQKPAPRWALGEVIPPEEAKRPRVPFVLRPAVEILVLCTYFCIIISLYNFPLFFIFLLLPFTWRRIKTRLLCALPSCLEVSSFTRHHNKYTYFHLIKDTPQEQKRGEKHTAMRTLCRGRLEAEGFLEESERCLKTPPFLSDCLVPHCYLP